MTIASIDIGSNTVLLLIAEYDRKNRTLNTIANRYSTPRISEGLLPGGRISESKIKLLTEIIAEYKTIALQNKCSVILLKATNAFRIASNSQEIVQLLLERFSLQTEIISGEEEARITFLGSTHPLNENESKTVIDIGGGSTEIIYGNLNGVIYKNSFDIGVVSLTEKFFHLLPSSQEIVSGAVQYIDQIFKDISSLVPLNVKTIAVAGTPTTLSCIKQGIKIFDEARVDDSILTASDLEFIIKMLAGLSKEEVLRKFGNVVSGREDLLFAGSLILRSIMRQLNLTELTVSSKGLRYGTVIDYLIRNQLMNTAR